MGFLVFHLPWNTCFPIDLLQKGIRAENYSTLRFRIKRNFLRHKTVKTNNKIRRFGVVMTPLFRKNVFDHANYSI